MQLLSLLLLLILLLIRIKTTSLEMKTWQGMLNSTAKASGTLMRKYTLKHPCCNAEVWICDSDKISGYADLWFTSLGQLSSLGRRPDLSCYGDLQKKFFS